MTHQADLARTAVITIARGRHTHLTHQLRSLAKRPGLGHFVLVSMGDPALTTVLSRERPPAREVLMRDLPILDGEGDLPLAAARNLGAQSAIDAGAEVLVFLDIDCVAGPGLVERYTQAAFELVHQPKPVVLCGEVGYLPAGADLDDPGIPLSELAAPHVARPSPPPGTTEDSDRLDLFWSLSFAMTARHWRTVGGFCEDYVGYGGEDTDFGQLVAAAGGGLRWVGGAPAYHQHHGSVIPPVPHLAAIVRNANLFHRRWGWFPMSGWLEEFERRGLASFDVTSQTWVTSAEADREV